MQHIEFFHREHFEQNYHRRSPAGELSHFIDFIWETKFNELWDQNPDGFSDVLFPNIGYTYLINLGTPFVMQVEDKKFEMKTDGFLPRPNSIECHHQRGNHLFGIKFRISPVLAQKKVNFAEYKGYIFPLSYLLDQKVIDHIKQAKDFNERFDIVCDHYNDLLAGQHHSLQPAKVVSAIIDRCLSEKDFTISVEDLAARYNISSRTLQRYFETCTGISSKQALQIMRIRTAVNEIASSPDTFNYTNYGYYDYSHFNKHLKQFLQKETLVSLQPHLRILGKLRKEKER